MISVQRPFAFLFLLFLIPAILREIFAFAKLKSRFGGICDLAFFQLSDSQKSCFSYARRSFLFRFFFGCLSFSAAICAYSGISIGFRRVPIEKSGNAVSFVFDISYSMTARDSMIFDEKTDGISRLEASKKYAFELISKIRNDFRGTSISVVIAKGDGILAIPLTEDFSGIEAFIENLSPRLMTSSGSSIGKGILCAIKSFSSSTAMPRVWIFTDGEETDGNLSSAIDEAAKSGIPVTFVGFGSENPSEITAGDGKTKVKTALQSEKLIYLSQEANKKATVSSRQTQNENLISFIRAESNGSASFLLNQIKPKKTRIFNRGDNARFQFQNENFSSDESENANVVFENQPISRNKIFIFFAILFFVCSRFFPEFDFSNIRKISVSESADSDNFAGLSKKKAAFFFLSIFSVLFVFVSCGNEKYGILSGTWAWDSGKYQQAAANFLRVYTSAEAKNDKTAAAYASFALASTYIMQEEFDAALSRLAQIPPDINNELKSAAFYNTGICAIKSEDYKSAAEFFKQAILANPKNTDAKINLELCYSALKSLQNKNAEAEMSAISGENNDDSAAEKAIFNLIREEERQQWKNLQADEAESSASDY